MPDAERDNTLPHAAASTSSTPKGASPPADSITALGERILTEFGDERTSNTLTRWLAHHVARLIDAADSARHEGSADADAKAAQARAAILQLWNARTTWPTGWPPPRAAIIARLLDDLPDLENTSLWHRETLLADLQDLHHRILAALVDIAASDEGEDLEGAWLTSFGENLTPNEVSLLRRVANSRSRIEASVPHRFRACGDEVEPDADTAASKSLPTYPLRGLADAYRATILELLARADATQGDAANREAPEA
ncbi:hypothetical protein [Pseudofrankia sp. BMG5.36]|uniref:hypothetical protein n=1 Tax=Pseudofrankia sp. BMG5.36 TaxID=1834512 RepID=UPI0010423E67|nr:hypothetical protein [Pseudofrankia sp. BMG5.36]